MSIPCDETTMITPAAWDVIGLLLRDFFMSSQRHALELAAIKLHEHCSSNVDFPEIKATDWREVEYDFNRLFVGPMAILAPPYASVYIEIEPQLMGNSTLEVRQLYHALGLSVFRENHIPDDHLAHEIEICLLLVRQAAEKPVYAEALKWLAVEHMGKWVPTFIARVKQGAQTSLILAVTQVLSLWFYELQGRHHYE